MAKSLSSCPADPGFWTGPTDGRWDDRLRGDALVQSAGDHAELDALQPERWDADSVISGDGNASCTTKPLLLLFQLTSGQWDALWESCWKEKCFFLERTVSFHSVQMLLDLKNIRTQTQTQRYTRARLRPLTVSLWRYWPTEENHGGGGNPHARAAEEDLLGTCERGCKVLTKIEIPGCLWRSTTAEPRLCLQAQKYIQSLPFMPPQDLEKIFRGANPLGGWRHSWTGLTGTFGFWLPAVSPPPHLCSCVRQLSTSSSACWFWTAMGGSLPARPWPTPTSHSTTTRRTSPTPRLTTRAWRAKTELWRSGKARQELWNFQAHKLTNCVFFPVCCLCFSEPFPDLFVLHVDRVDI